MIFFYFKGHHGPARLVIFESEARDTRQEFLRKLTTRIVFNYQERQDEPLQRAVLLTRHEENDLDAFADWWRKSYKDFEFDSDAAKRYRDYWFRKYDRSESSRFNLKMEAAEREKISRDYFRTKLKPPSH